MIRSLTIGVPLYSQSTSELRQALGTFRDDADALSQSTGLPFRTVRLTLPPPQINAETEPAALRSIVQSAADLAGIVGARWYCLPIDLFQEAGQKALLDEALALVNRNSALFVNLVVAKPDAISLAGAKAASEFVLQLSRRSNNGIDNFRVGISAACPAGAPFFPFSRHKGEQPSFSIAMETASTALRIAEQARADNMSLADFQAALIDALQQDMARVDAYGRALAEQSGVAYNGLDGSLAPFPDGTTSIARLVELLGPTPMGSHGTVFITSILTDALKCAGRRANAKLIGFNGVMYSVLEDDLLSQANGLRAIDIGKLALFSTVCGCGIDMVPVPSTMYSEDIAGLILDIATLAIRLKKPLGVRLLPIPNRAVNEHTEFNLDFLCDSRVMDGGTSASKPMLDGATWRYTTDSENPTQ